MKLINLKEFFEWVWLDEGFRQMRQAELAKEMQDEAEAKRKREYDYELRLYKSNYDYKHRKEKHQPKIVVKNRTFKVEFGNPCYVSRVTFKQMKALESWIYLEELRKWNGGYPTGADGNDLGQRDRSVALRRYAMSDGTDADLFEEVSV